MLSSVTRTSSRRNTVASNAFLAFYSTVTGLARTNWRTNGPAPRPLRAVSYADEDNEEFSSSSLPAKFSPHRTLPKTPTPQQYRAHRAAIKEAFPDGWSPPRKLSRAAMDGMRWLHAQDPETCTTPMLAEKFRISSEAVRRILKSKWEPTVEQRAKLLEKERYSRNEWIMERRKEERETQEKVLKGRTMQPQELESMTEDGQAYETNRRRNPRGINRNDKLSFT